MEFQFNIDSVLKNEITIYKNGEVPRIKDKFRNHEFQNKLAAIVDDMGSASARAQGLYLPITTLNKVVQTKHTLYILKEVSGGEGGGKSKVLGILKTGKKRLFLTDIMGRMHESECSCVLDFYVHESKQRSGCGRKLFEAMLQEEESIPSRIPYDRPSHKLLAFLEKHYGLSQPIRQNNNYIVFPSFFQKETANPTQPVLPAEIQREDTKTLKQAARSAKDLYFPKYQAPQQRNRNSFSRYNSFSPASKGMEYNQAIASRSKANYSWTVSSVYDKYYRQNSKSEIFF